ncbi:hypothetical protein M3P05_08275 [Sansalvadorimonas sp. 2012CJ34-2]|uniref:Protein kinase domain-containing protein n=1 Tax=Parendozoicomonas callyspongiae TaxID=2942213 RepID=A0ABT0PGQ1_9GAMM|nr:hypothetical protein [Sansalvadorimonas sp. 2012CJ34-2]MCL6269932.1 hypothetical protein [Sansalvadorimonas sp. 2012CJ34-2]
MKLLFFMCAHWCFKKTLFMLFALIVCSQSAYSGSYSLVIDKGGVQIAVKLPKGHPFTKEILGLMRARDLLSALEQRQQEFQEESQVELQKLEIVSSLVKELSLPYELPSHASDLEHIPGQSERFHYKPVSLLPNHSFVISVTKSNVDRIWQDLSIERAPLYAGRLRWLFVAPPSTGDAQVTGTQEITAPSYVRLANTPDTARAVQASSVTDDEITNIRQKGCQNAQGDDQVQLCDDLMPLVDFYRTLLGRPEVIVNEINGSFVSETEYHETVDEYTRLANDLSDLDLMKWCFYAGLTWTDMQPFSDAVIEREQSNRESAVQHLVRALAALPRPLVKGALKSVSSAHGDRLKGPCFEKELVKKYVDRFTVDRLGALPDVFISRYDMTYCTDRTNCYRCPAWDLKRRTEFYTNFPSADLHIPRQYIEKVSKQHWSMAASEFLRARGNFNVACYKKYLSTWPYDIPCESALRESHKGITEWLFLREITSKYEVMLPIDCPSENIYFNTIEPVSGFIYGSDDFSAYVKAKPIAGKPEATIKCWHPEVSQSQRQEELAFYRNIAKLISAMNPPMLAQSFIPTVENRLLSIQRGVDSELTGLVLPRVGLSLRDVLILSNRLNLWQKIGLFQQITSAIQWAHKENIVFSHSERSEEKTALKLANIRIDDEGNPVCTSFQHAQWNRSQRPSHQNEWHEEKELDSMFLGKLMIECLLGREFQSFQDALTAAKPHQGEDSEEKLFSVWLRDRLLALGVTLIEGGDRIDIMLHRLSNLSVEKYHNQRSNVLTLPEHKMLQNPKAVLKRAASCTLCDSLYSSEDRDKNAMRPLFPNGMNAYQFSYCRACLSDLRGRSQDPGDQVLRDDISGFEALGGTLRKQDAANSGAVGTGATATAQEVVIDFNCGGDELSIDMGGLRISRERDPAPQGLWNRVTRFFRYK